MATKTSKVNTETEAKVTKKATTKVAAEKKPVEKKTAAKATTTKAATEKKATAKKSETKATANKNQLFVQFLGYQVSHEEMLEKVKADYAAKTGKKRVTSTELYVKPEDMRIYYVVNGSFTGDVELN